MATRGLSDEEIEEDLISMRLREHTRKRKHSSASSAQIARDRPPPGANAHAIEGSHRPVLRSIDTNDVSSISSDDAPSTGNIQNNPSSSDDDSDYIPSPTTHKYHMTPATSNTSQSNVLTSSSAAVAQPAPTFNNVPLGALDPKQPFKLNQPRPLGIQVPVDAAATSYEWKSYDRTSIDWSSKSELLRLNEWRTRATRARGKKLKAYTDARKKAV
ncbi:hypothetical protein D6C76_10067 [Aureobasidium pullulans]|nr:hypothetical protein D6C79_10223 [Aureobasidium pullulans]TIA62023.1 hypothetical protein D6C76_10067 [Aureobasidium pullulans]